MWIALKGTLKNEKIKKSVLEAATGPDALSRLSHGLNSMIAEGTF